MIRGSVGVGGRNFKGDVAYVQLLLCDWLVRQGRSAIKIDGIVGPITTGAIKGFQAAKTPFNDARIDPDGLTLQRLQDAHIVGICSGVSYVDSSNYGRRLNAETFADCARTYLRSLRDACEL